VRALSAAVLRTQPDATLAALAAGGSEPAFEAIVQRHRRALLAYCGRLLLSESRSEDVVQQAFVDAWSALRSGTEVRETRAWLYRITHNQAMRALRVTEYDFETLSETLSGAQAPESDLERRMLVREALAAVAALPEQQREAILRTAVDGHSYEEVAVALGISDDAVRGLVYRARASLRAGLAAAAPPPLVVWAAAYTRRGVPLAQWFADVLGGAGSSDSAAIALKSITVLATSVVVVSGTVGGAVEHVDRALVAGPHARVVMRREHARHRGSTGTPTVRLATSRGGGMAQSSLGAVGLGWPAAGPTSSPGRLYADRSAKTTTTAGAAMGTRPRGRVPGGIEHLDQAHAGGAAAGVGGDPRGRHGAIGAASGAGTIQPAADTRPAGNAVPASNLRFASAAASVGPSGSSDAPAQTDRPATGAEGRGPEDRPTGSVAPAAAAGASPAGDPPGGQ